MDNHVAILAEVLARQGIRYAFGVSGGGQSLELITHLEKNSVRFYPVAHEAAAALMAGACSRFGKTNAVAISIKGPGFANFVPGILSNVYENRPALTISEAYSQDVPSYRMHKRLDHQTLVASLGKGYGVADLDGKIVEDLINLAESEAPGPVHLDLCAEPAKNSFRSFQRSSVSSSIEAVKEALILIQGSKKPVVVLGSLALRRLQDIDWKQLKIPIVTTASAKGIIDETSPYAGGIVTGEIKELSPETAILKEADLIVAFGLRPSELVMAKPATIPLIAIDIIDSGLPRAEARLVSIVTNNLRGLTNEIVSALIAKQWGADLIAVTRREIVKEVLKDDWMPGAIFEVLNKKKLDRAITLVLDTGLFCTIGEAIYQAKSREEFLGSSGGRFMGTGIPTAIGAAIANPGRRIISMFGDGGIRPYLPEIKLAVREKLPILFVFMSDERYGTFAASAKTRGMSERAYAIHDSTWWKAVEVMGCVARLVRNLDQFNELVDQSFKFDGPMFLELHFNPGEYAVMTSKLR